MVHSLPEIQYGTRFVIGTTGACAIAFGCLSRLAATHAEVYAQAAVGITILAVALLGRSACAGLFELVGRLCAALILGGLVGAAVSGAIVGPFAMAARPAAFLLGGCLGALLGIIIDLWLRTSHRRHGH